jgi:hypothetical protein
MGNARRRLVRIGCLAVLLAPACQRLNYEKSFEIDADDVQAVLIDPPRSDQKVSISVSATGSPVDVYVVLEKDKPAAMKRLKDFQKPENTLAAKEKVQSDTLEATVPAKSGFVVLLANAKKTAQVQLKITGK